MGRVYLGYSWNIAKKRPMNDAEKKARDKKYEKDLKKKLAQKKKAPIVVVVLSSTDDFDEPWTTGDEG